jgi:hypothetical protein
MIKTIPFMLSLSKHVPHFFSSLLVNWYWKCALSENPPFPPFFKGGRIGSLPFVKGDLEGFIRVYNTTFTRPCADVVPP